jgi:hypothetical protein
MRIREQRQRFRCRNHAGDHQDQRGAVLHPFPDGADECAEQPPSEAVIVIIATVKLDESPEAS